MTSPPGYMINNLICHVRFVVAVVREDRRSLDRAIEALDEPLGIIEHSSVCFGKEHATTSKDMKDGLNYILTLLCLASRCMYAPLQAILLGNGESLKS
jgi:hypothetical protein